MIDSLDWKDIVDDRIDAPPQVIGTVKPNAVLSHYRRGRIIGKMWMTFHMLYHMRAAMLVNGFWLLTKKVDPLNLKVQVELVKFR